MLHYSSLPNLIVSGPIGSGRRDLIINFLKKIFNFQKPLKIQSQRKIVPPTDREVLLYHSDLYTEINPSLFGVADYVMMQTIVKEIAGTQTLFSTIKYRVILISEAEKMSDQAQYSLRRTIEKYDNARFIFITSNIDKIKPALKSRCTIVYNSGNHNLGNLKLGEINLNEKSGNYKKTEENNALNYIDYSNNTGIFEFDPILNNKEIEKISSEDFNKIKSFGGSNLFHTMFMLQLASVSDTKKINDFLPIWLSYFKNIARKIVSCENLDIIRKDIFNLEKQCFDYKFILMKLSENIGGLLGIEMAPHVFVIASKYDMYLERNCRGIFACEGFVIEIINMIENKKKGLDWENNILEILEN